MGNKNLGHFYDLTISEPSENIIRLTKRDLQLLDFPEISKVLQTISEKDYWTDLLTRPELE